MTLSPKAIQAALERMGVEAHLAAQAATNPKIDWTLEALHACRAYADGSAYDKPGADLWLNHLKLDRLPPAPAAAPVADDDDGFALPPRMLRFGNPARWPAWVQELAAGKEPAPREEVAAPPAPVVAAPAAAPAPEPTPAPAPAPPTPIGFVAFARALATNPLWRMDEQSATPDSKSYWRTPGTGKDGEA